MIGDSRNGEVPDGTSRSNDKEGVAVELEPVILSVHDRWFDLDAVMFDREAMSLTIPFWSAPTMRYPRDDAGQPKSFDRRMTIQGVTSYNVEDKERIGICSFNTVEREGDVLTIRADPHVTITVMGKDTSIALDELGEGESAGDG
jgi:hypothetical protein